MSDRVTTTYRKGGYADAEDVVLSMTATTRTVFRGGLHSGGVRGKVVRQKIGKNKEWKDLNEVNFNQMPADCGVEIELGTEAVATLRKHLEQLDAVRESGVPPGTNNLVVAPQDEVILVTDQNRRQVLEQLARSGRDWPYHPPWRSSARCSDNFSASTTTAS